MSRRAEKTSKKERERGSKVTEIKIRPPMPNLQGPTTTTPTVALYDGGKKTVFTNGQQTVEVNVRIKKTPNTPASTAPSSLKNIRRGSWADILLHSKDQDRDLDEKGHDQSDRKPSPPKNPPIRCAEKKEPPKVMEGVRSDEEDRLRAQLARVHMEKDALRKELTMAEEYGRTNEGLAKDYAKTVNELYQLCTALKAELADMRSERKREKGAGDAEPGPKPLHLAKFKHGLRDVKTAIEEEIQGLGRRPSSPLPPIDMERELDQLGNTARDLMGRKWGGGAGSGSSVESFEGLDASSTQYLNLPNRARSPGSRWSDF